MDLPEGREGWGPSSPGQARNQTDWPVLLYFSLSLVSLDPFHGAGFHPVFEIPLTCSLSQGENLGAKISGKAVSRGCNARLGLLCGLGRSLCFSVPVFPSWKTLLECPYVPHLMSIRHLWREGKLEKKSSVCQHAEIGDPVTDPTAKRRRPPYRKLVFQSRCSDSSLSEHFRTLPASLFIQSANINLISIKKIFYARC